jgi:hypothetical protein
MEQSKTGLLTPNSTAISAIGDASALAPSRVDVVVDACQARLTVASVAAYLRRGFMVLFTGSKFFTGPPFAGALLLPPVLAARLDMSGALPRGLAQYCSRFDWPEKASISPKLATHANLGLALRWQAALAEMRAFFAVDATTIKDILGLFARRLQAALRDNPDVWLHDVPALVRPELADGWDVLPTVFTFSIRVDRERGTPPRFLTPDEAHQVFLWLNSDISACLPPDATERDRILAARLFHIGQPVAIATGSGTHAGALRISAGARLVSGEPYMLARCAHLEPMARVELEIADALATVDKISLILKHRDAVRAGNARPRYETSATAASTISRTRP